MKKLRINRYKNPKWNVLFLVILVMLTASMMWLLTMNVLKQMFSYTIDLDWYYNGYYVSKAWLELALTEISNSKIWFSHQLTWWNSIFADNFSCGDNCDINLQVQGRANDLNEYFWDDTGCTSENAFRLAWWESFVLPLFYQNNSTNNSDIIWWQTSQVSLINKLSSIRLKSPVDFPSGVVNMWIVFEDMDIQMENIFVESYNLNDSDIFSDYVTKFNNQYPSSLVTYGNYPAYFVIMNPSENDIYFCLSSSEQLPTTKYFVISLWSYRWKYAWLQAIYAQPIPKFMLN